jgi:hypothetical protein
VCSGRVSRQVSGYLGRRPDDAEWSETGEEQTHIYSFRGPYERLTVQSRGTTNRESDQQTTVVLSVLPFVGLVLPTNPVKPDLCCGADVVPRPAAPTMSTVLHCCRLHPLFIPSTIFPFLSVRLYQILANGRFAVYLL